MKLLTVVGNRPQFVKAAALSQSLRNRHKEVLVHTGQHHDPALSAVFFKELPLPRPQFELGIHGGDNASQTARMLGALRKVCAAVAPDAVIVFGDTNSTLAGALAAAQAPTRFALKDKGRVAWRAGLPLIHVEAGMRADDWTMPEELNRVICDQLSTLLLAPTTRALENLRREGVLGRPGVVATVSGDLMADLALAVFPTLKGKEEEARRFGLTPQRYLLVSAHRPGTVDLPSRLRLLVDLLVSLSAAYPLLFPLHPRTAKRLAEGGLLRTLEAAPNIKLTDPLPYHTLAALLCQATAVVTDSGGLQKEAYLAGVRCLTLRDRTEWQETVDAGWNFLVDLDRGAAQAALTKPLPSVHPPLFGEGRAAERAVGAIERLGDLLRDAEGASLLRKEERLVS